MQPRTISLPSASVPGVSFTFMRIGPRVRSKFDLDNAEMIARLNQAQSTAIDLYDQLQKMLLANLGDPGSAPDGVIEPNEEMKDLGVKLGTAQAEYRRIENDELNPAWVRYALLNVSGAGLDGITAEELIDLGPETLYHEIVEAIGKSLKMTPDQMQAFWSATISGAQVDSPKTASDAPTAESQEPTPIETAVSIPSSQST